MLQAYTCAWCCKTGILVCDPWSLLVSFVVDAHVTGLCKHSNAMICTSYVWTVVVVLMCSTVYADQCVGCCWLPSCCASQSSIVPYAWSMCWAISRSLSVSSVSSTSVSDRMSSRLTAQVPSGKFLALAVTSPFMLMHTVDCTIIAQTV